MYTERVTVQRAPLATGLPSGAAEKAYATLISNLPMRITARSGSYRQQSYGMSVESNYVGYTPGRPDIKAGDRILHGTAIYDVTFVRTEARHHLELDLALVTVQ